MSEKYFDFSHAGLFYEYAGDWLQQHRGTPADQERLLTASTDLYRDFVSFAQRQLKKTAAEAGGVQSPLLARQLEVLEEQLSAEPSRARSTKELEAPR